PGIRLTARLHRLSEQHCGLESGFSFLEDGQPFYVRETASQAQGSVDHFRGSCTTFKTLCFRHEPIVCIAHPGSQIPNARFALIHMTQICPVTDIRILIYDTFISMKPTLCDAGAKAKGRLKA
ncbi:hypothetical protein, partial [Pseudomonas syringae]|uniref:hypothetical protein n=1 Tax=Pseudomonas syringae TaxID=317 RepID=UPI001E5CEEAC